MACSIIRPNWYTNLDIFPKSIISMDKPPKFIHRLFTRSRRDFMPIHIVLLLISLRIETTFYTTFETSASFLSQFDLGENLV